MINKSVKPDYSADVEKFVASGGEIKQAVNTHKAEFNHFSESQAKHNNHHNAVLRKRAENAGLKSYKPVSPCKSCATSERSVKSNACLECDRRRFRAKTAIKSKNIEAIAHYLLSKSESFEFSSGGKKYILKVEVA